MKLQLILINVFLLLLGSCCKDCPINQENINYPTSTRSGISYVNDKADLSRIAWWKKLKDPELDRLIAQALGCNNTIKSSYATIQQAQAQLKLAQYAWIPTLDATSNGFSGGTWHTQLTPEGPPDNTLFANRSNMRFRGYNNGFLPSYSVNILSNINNTKAARASLALQQAQAQSTKLGIISQMSGTYFMLLSQREQLAVEKALTRDLRQQHKLEQIRYKKGANDVATLINFDQQIAQEEAKIPQIAAVIAQSENTIHLLMDQNPGPVSTHQSLLSLNLTELIPKDLPSSVLKNRPDIMIALHNLERASAEIGLAYSAFFPTISLTSLFGDVSFELVHLLKLSAGLWIAKATASTELINFSDFQTIKAAKAGFMATYYDYLQKLRAAFADVDDNLSNSQKNRLTYLQTEQAYFAAKRAHALAFVQYKAGAKDYRSVVNAKINLERSQLTLIQDKAHLLDSIVGVYTAVAGGYDLLKTG